MIRFDLMEYYDTLEAANAFHDAARGLPTRLRSHTELHLSGIISVILGRSIRNTTDISTDDVIRLNNSICTENGTILNTSDISENPLQALEDIAQALTKAMHPDGTALGIVNADSEPVILDMTGYYGMDPQAQAPKRPNLFKRLLNKIFGAFKDECDTYRKWEEINKRKASIDPDAFAANTARQSELSEQLSRNELSVNTAPEMTSDSNQHELENELENEHELNNKHENENEILQELTSELAADRDVMSDSLNVESATKSADELISQDEITKLYAQLSDIANSEAKSTYHKLYRLSKGYTFEQLDSNHSEDSKTYQSLEDALSVTDAETFAKQNALEHDSTTAKLSYHKYLLEKKQQITELFTNTLSAPLHSLEADIKTIQTQRSATTLKTFKNKIDLLLNAGAACNEAANSLLELDSSNAQLINTAGYANAIQVYNVLNKYIVKRSEFGNPLSVHEDNYEAQNVISLKAVSDKLLNEFDAEKATSTDIRFYLELPDQEMKEYSAVPKPAIEVISSQWQTEDQRLRHDPKTALASDKLPSTHIEAMKRATEKLNKKYELESKGIQRMQVDLSSLEQQEGMKVKSNVTTAVAKLKGKELDIDIHKQINNYNRLDSRTDRATNKLLPGNIASCSYISRKISDLRDEYTNVLKGLEDKEIKSGLVTLYLLSEGMDADTIFDTPAPMQQKKEELIDKFVTDITIMSDEAFNKANGIESESETNKGKYDAYCRNREKEIMDMFSDKLAPMLHKMEGAIGAVDINDPQSLIDNYRAIQICTKCAHAFNKSIRATADFNRNSKLNQEVNYANDLNLYNIINSYTEYRGYVATDEDLDAESTFFALMSKAGAEILIDKLDGKKIDEADLKQKSIENIKKVCENGFDENQKLVFEMKKLNLKGMLPNIKEAVLQNKDATFLQQFYNDGTLSKSSFEFNLKSAGKSM